MTKYMILHQQRDFLHVSVNCIMYITTILFSVFFLVHLLITLDYAWCHAYIDSRDSTFRSSENPYLLLYLLDDRLSYISLVEHRPSYFLFHSVFSFVDMVYYVTS